MPHSTARKRGRQIEMVRQQFAQTEGLAFADVLPAEQIERVLQEEKATWREKVFTPPLTLWAFLGQVISPDEPARSVQELHRSEGERDQRHHLDVGWESRRGPANRRYFGNHRIVSLHIPGILRSQCGAP